MILVIGATGTVGTELVHQLVEARHHLRALVRDRSKGRLLCPTVEVVVGDLSEPQTLPPVFAGVEKAFVLSVGPDIEKLEANAFEAAKEAGVRHIVKLSAGSIDADFFADAPGASWHRGSEKRLRQLGIAWTILRPGPFASNVLKLYGIIQRGGLFLPTGNGKDAPIDPRDIAAVAVTVLTTPGHEGKTYELTGPELLSFAEIVNKVAAATGRRLKFVDVPEDATRQSMLTAGSPPPMVDTLMCYYAAVKAGRWSVTSTVADILGRPARTFDEWVKDHIAELG
jgi:uncharacterized protein YbjT (DUF2867 family)